MLRRGVGKRAQGGPAHHSCGQRIRRHCHTRRHVTRRRCSRQSAGLLSNDAGLDRICVGVDPPTRHHAQLGLRTGGIVLSALDSFSNHDQEEVTDVQHLRVALLELERLAVTLDARPRLAQDPQLEELLTRLCTPAPERDLLPRHSHVVDAGDGVFTDTGMVAAQGALTPRRHVDAAQALDGGKQTHLKFGSGAFSFPLE